MIRASRVITVVSLLGLSSCLSSDGSPSEPAGFQPSDPAVVERFALQHVAATVPEVANQVRVRDVGVDALGYAYAKLGQEVSGVPVFGSGAIVQLDSQGNVVRMIDRLVRDVRVDMALRVDVQTALALAVDAQGANTAQVSSRADLQILVGHGKDRLTHRVVLDYVALGRPHREVVFVDAATGDIAWVYDDLKTEESRGAQPQPRHDAAGPARPRRRRPCDGRLRYRRELRPARRDLRLLQEPVQPGLVRQRGREADRVGALQHELRQRVLGRHADGVRRRR
jgi:Fungalysin/Thermolysin Propeptide Motif